MSRRKLKKAVKRLAALGLRPFGILDYIRRRMPNTSSLHPCRRIPDRFKHWGRRRREMAERLLGVVIHWEAKA